MAANDFIIERQMLDPVFILRPVIIYDSYALNELVNLIMYSNL